MYIICSYHVQGPRGTRARRSLAKLVHRDFKMCLSEFIVPLPCSTFVTLAPIPGRPFPRCPTLTPKNNDTYAMNTQPQTNNSMSVSNSLAISWRRARLALQVVTNRYAESNTWQAVANPLTAFSPLPRNRASWALCSEPLPTPALAGIWQVERHRWVDPTEPWGFAHGRPDVGLLCFSRRATLSPSRRLAPSAGCCASPPATLGNQHFAAQPG